MTITSYPGSFLFNIIISPVISSNTIRIGRVRITDSRYMLDLHLGCCHKRTNHQPLDMNKIQKKIKNHLNISFSISALCPHFIRDNQEFIHVIRGSIYNSLWHHSS